MANALGASLSTAVTQAGQGVLNLQYVLPAGQTLSADALRKIQSVFESVVERLSQPLPSNTIRTNWIALEAGVPPPRQSQPPTPSGNGLVPSIADQPPAQMPARRCSMDELLRLAAGGSPTGRSTPTTKVT